MKYLPFCLLLALSPLAGIADNNTATTPASKTYDAKGKLLQKTDDKGRHYKASTRAKPPTTANTMTPKASSPAKRSPPQPATKAMTLKASCCKKLTNAAAFLTPKANIRAK
jgi:hypothetical protein